MLNIFKKYYYLICLSYAFTASINIETGWSFNQTVEQAFYLFENIYIDDDCTRCNQKNFFSYRREGESAGRMIAIAGWTLF